MLWKVNGNSLIKIIFTSGFLKIDAFFKFKKKKSLYFLVNLPIQCTTKDILFSMEAPT